LNFGENEKGDQDADDRGSSPNEVECDFEQKVFSLLFQFFSSYFPKIRYYGVIREEFGKCDLRAFRIFSSKAFSHAKNFNILMLCKTSFIKLTLLSLAFIKLSCTLANLVA
jgi:hypothetical protein